MDECEHTIKIDKYMELRIKIPKELNVIEFTALLEKARKTLKLGEIEVETKSGKNSGRKYLIKNEDKLAFLKEYEEQGIKHMMEKYNTTKSSIYNRVYKYKELQEVKESKQKGRPDTIDSSTADKMIDMRKEGKTYDEIGKAFGQSKGQAWAVVKRRAKKLGIKL